MPMGLGVMGMRLELDVLVGDAPPAVTDLIVQEDGFNFLLEDGTGALAQE